MSYANGEDRQAPPETDSNIWIGLWKCLSVSTDYKRWLASFIYMLQSSTCYKAEGNEGFLFNLDMHMQDWTKKCQFLPSLGEKIELHRDVSMWDLSANNADKNVKTAGKALD